MLVLFEVIQNLYRSSLDFYFNLTYYVIWGHNRLEYYLIVRKDKDGAMQDDRRVSRLNILNLINPRQLQCKLANLIFLDSIRENTKIIIKEAIDPIEIRFNGWTETNRRHKSGQFSGPVYSSSFPVNPVCSKWSLDKAGDISDKIIIVGDFLILQTTT